MDSYIFSGTILPDSVREEAVKLGSRLTGIRLRPERPVQLVYQGGDRLCDIISKRRFEEAVLELMGHSLYARENELEEGYFMLPDGSRAGVCGRFAGHGPRSVSDISSVCIRIAREITGCAEGIRSVVTNARGCLIVSPPGIGKTTILRDLARLISEFGNNVCIIDERGEIAACADGIPRMNVGPRTDVITGLEKYSAIICAVRSCAPDVIVTDEIGDDRDAFAIAEALRAGVRIIASAHGTSLNGRGLRKPVKDMLAQEMFDVGILLGPEIGQIAGICSYSERGSD